MNKDVFGAFVAEIRKETGMTQQNLADRLHVTDKAVSKWERGLCFPDLTMMEPLSAALGVTVAELMNCQRQTQEPAVKENEAVLSLLDISGSILKGQRKVIWLRAALFLLIVLGLVVGSVYVSANVEELRQSRVVMKQTEDDRYYVFLSEGNRLLRLRCPDRATYDFVEANGENVYRIQYRWNRITCQGTIESCELVGSVALGGMMDQIGSSIDFGGLFGVACVWMEYCNIYPNPNLAGEWLYTYRLWYYGDGSDYFAEGDETHLVTVEDCRCICADDYDNDGIEELFVLTRYNEQPYMVCDLENGEITKYFLPDVPVQVAEFFQQEMSRS